MQLRREPVPLAEVVARAVDLYRDVAEAKGVTLAAAAPADIVVTADRTRLEQVAANLIDNAVKYTPAGGRVDVEIERDADAAMLRVRDTGSGHSRRRTAADLRSPLPRRHQPRRARPRSRPQPGQGHRRGAWRARSRSAASRVADRRSPSGCRSASLRAPSAIAHPPIPNPRSLHRCNAPATAPQGSPSSYSLESIADSKGRRDCYEKDVYWRCWQRAR